MAKQNSFHECTMDKRRETIISKRISDKIPHLLLTKIWQNIYWRKFSDLIQNIQKLIPEVIFKAVLLNSEKKIKISIISTSFELCCEGARFSEAHKNIKTERKGTFPETDSQISS